MPLWKIYHSPGILEAKGERKAIAEAVTQFYVSVGLPDFYVQVHFYPVSSEQWFIAGKEAPQNVGIEILHVARNWDPTDKARATKIKNAVDNIMKPYTIDRGIHLEFFVLEGPAGLWRINGIDPPEAFGPDEQEHAELNRKKLIEDYQRRH